MRLRGHARQIGERQLNARGALEGPVELDLILFEKPDGKRAIRLESAAAITAIADQNGLPELVRLTDFHAGKGFAHLAADFINALGMRHVLRYRHSLLAH